MKTHLIYILLFSGVLAFSACKKGEPLQEKVFTSITVTSKDLVDVPSVLIYADDVLLDTLDKGASLTSLLKRDKPTIRLSVRSLQTGEHLLDSVFKVQVNNSFTILIDQALNIKQFYKPGVSQVDAQHIRMQLYHKIVFNDVEQKKVNFKFFTRVGSTGAFTPTNYELKNVEFGKLSEPIDLPTDPTGLFKYYVKTYNSETGDLLIDLYEDYGDGAIFYTVGGKSIVVNVKTDDYPPYGAFYNLLDWYVF